MPANFGLKKEHPINNQIMIYETGGKQVQFQFDNNTDTIWATQAQMAELFAITPQTIARHLKDIYQEGELEETRTCTKNVQVQTEGKRQVSRTLKTYNLDAIISVGYRVNSRKATDFRIWATKVLKNYIVNGVAINERRLSELSQQRLLEVSNALGIVKRLIAQNEFTGDEGGGILEVITRYATTFRTLREYDDGLIRISDSPRAKYILEAGECMEMIDQVREQLNAGEKFGQPRGDSFEGALRAIYQSFAGEDVYPTLAEKAANLLYFIIKDHPFFDGNKRIASFLFIMFLTLNKSNLTDNGNLKISDHTLVAIALMIAESHPREKGLMTAVVCKILE